ncbi:MULTISPECIES: hypothetical protein [Methylophaga]|jgi:hypothetical protein|nr:MULTISPECIES: hypothetical protein [Methylophaga]MCB2425476.1 hypothetical protein [Methylophaga pinxianii]MDO8826028.1 hypothetical protein [Methylophaga sp.]MDX1751448.1 hypothetical protein [Methylophaga sp.]UPH47203.1 hypothetical protein LGT42_015445 [Methylophaga pinxianii]|tara:strand:+ start:3373 stop:3513 length:141 start_codon:yes stop_codon:yes gene_type:complete
MMAYIELIRPELLIGLGVLVIGCALLGAIAIVVDNKRENDQNNHSH